MWRLRHGLGAADETELGVAENDFLSAADDGLEAGSAKAIQSQGRSLLSRAGFERDMPREVDRVAGCIEDVAEDGLIDVVGPDAGSIDRVF